MSTDFKPITIKNYIAGAWHATGSEGTAEDRNPANTDDLVGNYPVAGTSEVETAVAAAKEAFKSWRLVPAPKRAEIIRRAGDLLARDKNELAVLMTREMGKPTFETGGDAQEGIDTAYYCAGEGRRLFGDTVPCELPNKFGMSIRVPVGVAGVITPWNFPMAIPTWNIFPALVAGNVVILKPSPETPATAMRLVEILLEAGMPANVVQTVSGGISTGEALVNHPGIGVISFTGSTATGRKIAEAAGRGLKRLALEMGGKNAMIVMDDADLELALEGALWGAFGTTGQRCTATSRLILHEAIHDEFVSRLAERASKLRIGAGTDPKTEMGPLVNATQRDRVANYVKIGKEEDKATLVIGGGIPQGDQYAKGYFFQPTIFTDVKPNSRIAQEEIFGPIVSCIKIKSFEEAIEVLNGTMYGLSSSIYTRDVNQAFQAIRDIEAGITYVNGPTIGAEVQLPFGGVKGTGNGHREAGHAVLDIYTEWKSVYIDYSGRLQKAQIDAE